MGDLYADVWASEPFTMVSMTEYIDRAPYAPDIIDRTLLWRPDFSLTPEVGIDVQDSKLYLLPIVGRDENLPTASRTDRFSAKLPIPRYGEQASVKNSEVLGVRDTGTINLRTVETLRNMKVNGIKERVEATSSFCQWRALDGLVVNPANPAQVLENIHLKLGTRPRGAHWDFSDATLDPNNLLGALKRVVQDTVGNAIYLKEVNFKLLCGRQFFRALRLVPKVVEGFKDFAPQNAMMDALRFARGDVKGPSFILADDVEVVDAGNSRINTSLGSHIGAAFVPENMAYLVPNVADFFRVVYGPSDYTQYLGNPIPYYVTQSPLGEEGARKGITLTGETFRLYYVTRPDACLKIIGDNIALPAAMTDAGVVYLDA